LLVTLGAALTVGEWPALSGIIGILLISGGIISLAFRGRRLPEAGIFYAIGTGAFIAAYSVTDGIGGRLSGQPVAYTVWMCLAWSASALPIYLVLRPGGALWRGMRQTGLAALGGLISLGAYRYRDLRMTRAHMGAVSALRETSVLFAVLLGRVFFGETLTARRLLSALIIVAGALCLK
jgi:drug/metabolite transporter (DMT)-like permease